MNLCDTLFLQGLIVVSREELPLWPLCILLICIFHCLFISIQITLNFTLKTIIHLNLFRKELFACYKDLAYSMDRK